MGEYTPAIPTPYDPSGTTAVSKTDDRIRFFLTCLAVFFGLALLWTWLR